MDRPRGAYSRWLLVASLLFSFSCRDDARQASLPGAVLLVYPDDADPLGERLAQSTARYLETITNRPIVSAPVADDDFDSLPELEALASRHRAGLVVVLEAERLASDRIDDARMAALGEQGFVLETHDMGRWNGPLGDEPGATVVLTAGATRLSRQYAVYELLRRLGVRFFHPEQEHVPVHDPADLRDLVRRPTALHRAGQRGDYEPDFRWRSWSFHGAHPLEHLEAFSDPEHPIDEAVHVNDWIVKGFGNRFRGAGRGVASEEALAQRAAELEELRVLLGFPTGTGLSLHNLQQGASAEIDPSSSIPVQQQIETLVAQKLADKPDARWFGIHFGPTEFTTTPDEETVQWIDWAGQAALRLRPDLEIEINDHITGSQPSPHFDDLGCPPGTNDDGRIDYYDLAFHSDPRLGVSVHTVMFYPLEGPARVYAQESFAHKRCLMQEASARGRPLTWFPEGAWWLSFDNSIPVYLPLYMWTRARDIELLRPLLRSRGGGTLDGHRMFDTGHEWGYWQQDYMVGLMAWNADITLPQVLGEIFDPLCEPAAWRDGCAAKDEALAVMQEVIEHQRAMFLQQEDFRGRPGGLYAYFAGEDDADVLAADSGLEFRPVRVAFTELLGWDADAIAHFRATDLRALQQAATAYDGWRSRLDALVDEIPGSGQPWLDEVRDGIEIDGLRAAHTALLYDAVLDYREAVLAELEVPAEASHASWLEALGVLAQASTVLQRREASYRYPAAQTHGGGLTPDTAVDNGTTYPYRVHTKTHAMTYWLGRQSEVTDILVSSADEASGLRLLEAIDAVGKPLAVQWPSLPELGGSLDVGGQTLLPPATALDLGGTAGYWSVSGQLVSGGSPIAVTGGIVRSNIRASTPAKGMTLIQPTDPAAAGVLAGVLPSLRWAWVPQPQALAFAPDRDGDGSVGFDDVVYAPVVEGDASAFRTALVSFDLPVGATSGGQELHITIAQAELSGSVGAEGIANPVVLDGQLSVDDIVTAAIELAGFDEAGTLALLGGVWGFDPANPPQWVPIEAELTVE
ncbi:hypothetical protein [Paraliomyxa miuraensis]|uniref:hypothetical protein n=1 Tax=Paraliomyxa miuraensis TaxID=376150 RepID=UPI00225AD946|nr:hypothetical protein [Paraliomyxa miuraensis]